jgi:hypothetical protein
MGKSLFSLICIFCLVACQSEPKQPETPEEVLRQYQHYIDNNQFEEAKTLSTDSGKEWLTELASIIADEQPDSTLLVTKFISLNCEEEGDVLICVCVLEDQYEKYPAEYRLLKIDDQWLVDAPEEEIIIENDIIEALPDSLLDKIMEEDIEE